MKIILLTDISKLGKRFDVKDVSSGHALNFLIPKNLAIVATSHALKKLEKDKAKTDGEKKVQNELLHKNMDSLDGKSLFMKGKASDKGHLFAGLHREEVAKEIEKQLSISISPESIDLEHPIKESGEYTVKVKNAGKEVSFKLLVNK